LNHEDFASILKLSSGVGPISPPVQDQPASTTAEPSGNQNAVLRPPGARATDQYDKLKAMFAKYNMVFDESMWPSRVSVQGPRVEKTIRMRVRIICHYCQTNYSSSRECTNCHHRRCEKCTRVPAKKKQKGKEREPEKMLKESTAGPALLPAAGRVPVRGTAQDADALSADDAEDEAEVSRSALKKVPKRPKRRKEVPLVVPSRTGGQDLVRKEPVQRVHRTCCKCQRSFKRDTTECQQCGHWRCTKCPRQPPKLDKWPKGYPGDVIPPERERIPRLWKKPRVRVRWTCHECRKLFMEGEYRCANCSHARCSDCERDPPKRGPQQFTQQAVTSVQARLAAVGAPSQQPDVAEDSTVAASSSKVQQKDEEAPKPSEGVD
jgi:hypothetical protein